MGTHLPTRAPTTAVVMAKGRLLLVAAMAILTQVLPIYGEDQGNMDADLAMEPGSLGVVEREGRSAHPHDFPHLPISLLTRLAPRHTRNYLLARLAPRHTRPYLPIAAIPQSLDIGQSSLALDRGGDLQRRSEDKKFFGHAKER